MVLNHAGFFQNIVFLSSQIFEQSSAKGYEFFSSLQASAALFLSVKIPNTAAPLPVISVPDEPCFFIIDLMLAISPGRVVSSKVFSAELMRVVMLSFAHAFKIRSLS